MGVIMDCTRTVRPNYTLPLACCCYVVHTRSSPNQFPANTSEQFSDPNVNSAGHIYNHINTLSCHEPPHVWRRIVICITSQASRLSPPESVVRLTIVSGTITNDVSAVLRSTDRSGEYHGGGKGEEGIGTPAGVCVRVCLRCISIIVRVVVDPLVVSSEHTDCDRIEGDGGVSSACCVVVVVVVVNPATQTNEHCEVVSPGAASQMIKSNCTYTNYCSLALVTPPAF